MPVKSMSHYCTIQILPDPDFPAHQVMTAVYMRLHQALVELGQSQVGINFPQYQRTPRSLGREIRLHSRSADLETLLVGKWLQKGVRDHILISDIESVPETNQFCLVSRVQPKYNVERLIRRQQQRKALSYEEVRERYREYQTPTERWPFVEMRSRSRGQTFSLFINQRLIETEKKGVFSSYGLSATSTVPWF